jgi:hypothetical protein
MPTITSGKWIADLGAMKCRNIFNNIVVVFEKKGKALIGKIEYIPMELFARWAEKPDGEKYVEKAVTEAEEVFTRAYIENDIETNGIRKEWL